MVNTSLANAEDTGDLGSIPGSARSPGEGNSNLFLYSCLENSMDRGAWWAIVLGVTRSQTQLSSLCFNFQPLTFQLTQRIACKIIHYLIGLGRL